MSISEQESSAQSIADQESSIHQAQQPHQVQPVHAQEQPHQASFGQEGGILKGFFGSDNQKVGSNEAAVTAVHGGSFGIDFDYSQVPGW